MTDPFVQRMMARSQARRGQNKENAAITDVTRSKLKQINSRYSDDTQPPTTPLLISNSDIAGYQEDQPAFPIRNMDCSPKRTVSSPVKENSSPMKSKEVITSPSRPRLNALARRSQQVNNWEDDYAYHSTNNRCQVEVEGSSSSTSSTNLVHSFALNVHATNTDSVEVPQISRKISDSPSKLKNDSLPSSCVQNSGDIGVSAQNSGASATVPKYYFGDGPSAVVSRDGTPTLSEISKVLPSRNKFVTVSSSSSCDVVNNSPSKPDMSRKKTPVPQAQNFSSPAKKLAWDQGLLNSLEAQGYTPTESRSRLYYDFKTPKEEEPSVPVSPSKVKGMSLAEFMRNSPPKGRSSVKENGNCASASNNQLGLKHVNQGASAPNVPSLPPVILTCHPKSPASSPVRSMSRIPSPEPKYKDRNRDCSPSKVGEMRSRWEQHIRDASPERSDRSRSPVKSHARAPSPVKPFTSQSNSHLTTGSPIRESTGNKFGGLARQLSHEQGVSNRLSPERRSLRDLSPVKDQGGLSRFGAERKSRRDLSPHKPPPVGDIVKGAAPMPEAVPLVNDVYMSSVKARAAAFDSAAGPREPVKDPAERSVQERRALFSKNQGAALVPKAPFGQSVPARSLQADGSISRDSASVTSVARSQPVHKPVKRLAVEPSPGIAQKQQQIHRGDRSPSPSSFDSQRMHFENVKDNWQDNEINSKIQAERQREMDVLLNRFKRPKGSAPAVQPRVNERPKYNGESETEYAESDESFDDAASNACASGPPKPPRLYLDSVSSESSVVSSSPPPPPPSFSDGSPVQEIRSPTARLNSTEIHERRTSPKKEFVPKIKPGCLFPSLSDIESQSEAPDSQDEDDIQDSSFAESILTCASIESLGQKIKQAAQSNLNKQLSTISEQSEIPSNMVYTMSQSTMEAIEAIDNAIDEALDDEPTPPKRQRTLENESNVFKTPKITPGSPSQNTEDQSSLAHSISMYRKQKPDVPCTPVRQIVRHPDLRSPTPEPPESPSVTVSARIRELQQEVAEQQRVISQASNAVTVVLQHTEHQGTPQHVEAEKLLLLSTQKRQTALDEIQRLKTEGAMAQSSWSTEVDTCTGSISISNISVPLKQDFIKRGMNGNEVYHLIVLVKHREQVISSQLMATPSCVVDGSVTFPNLMSLHNLASDFIISLEVYALRTLHERHNAIKKEQSRMKLTPLKRLQKNESRVASPASVQSPGGPFAVRSSSFQLVGFTHLNISTLTRNAWTLEKVPFSSPLDGHLLMHVSCSFEGGITERGFLTMFEDIGGFGAWNRRWCVLSGMYLRYWRYPDDESRKEPTGQIDLRSCTTRRVELVSRDICARQHTFQLLCLRPAYSGDVSNLVQEVQGSSVVTKHLLSADCKEERIQWCNKLNKSLANIRAWDPDALRPEDYQV